MHTDRQYLFPKGGVSKGAVGASHNSPRFQPGGGGSVSLPLRLHPVRVPLYIWI